MWRCEVPGAVSTGHATKKDAETAARRALMRGNRAVVVVEVETGKRHLPYPSGAVIRFRLAI